MILNFGKHRGQRVEDLPDDYITWALENLDERRHGALLKELREQVDLRSGKGVVRQAAVLLWTSGEIEIVGDGERLKIPAKIRGPFAIHPTQHRLLPVRYDEWTLTHIPTGSYVADRLTSEAAALALADTIVDLIDWRSATPVSLLRLTGDAHARLNDAIADARRVNP